MASRGVRGSDIAEITDAVRTLRRTVYHYHMERSRLHRCRYLPQRQMP